MRIGKKFHLDDQGIPYLSNRKVQSLFSTNTIYDRSWSQTRVYKISNTGTIISTNIFNNSGTVLNPTETPNNIIIDENNWQKSWLESWDNYKTELYRYPNNAVWENFLYLEYRTGEARDLNTAYRTFYGDRRTRYLKGIPNTLIGRSLIEFASFGTLTNNGFVFVEPDDLFDKNVELDYSLSFGTSFFPGVNYSIFSGLINQTQTNSVYYNVTGIYENNGDFTQQLIQENFTEFSKLDISGLELELPTEIREQDWDIANPDLLRVGIKAIAFLG